VDLLLDTIRNLRAHALRYLLTSLGITWGVLMLTYLSATIDGYDVHFEAQIAKMGPRLVYLFPGWVTKPGLGQRGTRPVELEREDVERIEVLHALDYAGANLWLGPRVLRAAGRTKLVWSYGGSPETLTIRNYQIAQGRGLEARDEAASARVVFLGSQVAERLFGDRNAVGQRITIDSIPFRVVGVSAEKGEQIVSQGPPDDELAWVPVRTAQRWLTRDDSVGQVIFAPHSNDIGPQATRAVRALLGLHHGFQADDQMALSHFDMQEVMKIIQAILIGLRVFLNAATGVTLLVGAAGVMNIMLVVVTERTREIGLRKAIGAPSAAIFRQFLAETLAVTLCSGLLGAGIGIVLIGLARAGLEGNTLTPIPIVRPAAIALVLGTIVGLGLLAGLLPAFRAARIEPAISLRAPE